ncbi:MAG: bifunctional riboflavin kinase/FAD synthetase [Xanthomonadales bacterium]|nr:bifunctional riboflavin kinase/FAD synthetase [Gammaproteobacteria bacterium]MBT8054650.1 bifunctional riboflavin kinase/FAD synthetase [Gammaproteobacteria bacterium]NND55740.1 bifunctional riboflavin kinase/FAD synthetase [Xanthomonadales bacterium]NNK50151.1 bifunctional riboflavin kinase/FAD synthetase [Xanthomonadales bacterium]NNL94571.1 bifunctional riboflavin kinase/FAD synthetase [Xanthomonadales bacterium]
MRVIRNRPEWNHGARGFGRSVVAIGNFDGIHLGHRALLDRSRQLAGPSGAVAVVTFEPLPLAFFRPEQAPARLSTIYQKLSLLRAAGVDITWLMRFDRELAALSAREFVEQILVRKLNASAVVVGEDFRFGKGREGDVAMLRSSGGSMNFAVETVAAVRFDGERISSSGIRSKLAAGDFSSAADWLGRPFRMEGHVIRGAGLGRTLGYPTANLAVRAEPSPLGGVLAAYSRVEGGPWLPSVINLGRRPAVGGKEPLLEVHFFDFNQDLYGQRLEVQFVAKLRDELDFESLDDLVVQMKRDEQDARRCLARAEMPQDEPVG